MTKHAPGTIGSSDAARLLGIGRRHVARLAENGVFPPSIGGRYQTIALVQGYIRSLTESRKEDAQISAENRIRNARAREYEVRTARAVQELGSISELEELLDEVTGMLQANMVGFGAEITSDPAIAARIDAHVARIFDKSEKHRRKALRELRGQDEVLEELPD